MFPSLKILEIYGGLFSSLKIVEIVLLGLGVRWTVDPAAGLADVFQDHGIPPGRTVGRVRSAPHVLESRRA